jgi:glycosyltransferase involved in cell wall biosynthesis
VVQARALTASKTYTAFIGIEKLGLLWADSVAADASVPLVYWSLELYTWDHWYCQDLVNQRIKLAEERVHRRCQATIIQDKMRGDYLLKDNGVTRDMRMVYFPISRSGQYRNSKDEWLRQSLNLDDQIAIILSYGIVMESRYVFELTQSAQNFPKNWILVFHGPRAYNSTATEEVLLLDKNNKVRVSHQLVPSADELKILSSATISLVLYDSILMNNELTGFASEKLALSLQAGVPIIAFDHRSYAHIRELKCGVLIKDISELPTAIDCVLSDYDLFKANAFLAFERYYRFENNVTQLNNLIDQLATDIRAENRGT